mgnify:CR=1 FL=1
MSAFPLRLDQQRTLFLVVSGISTAGSFAGITAKGWILLHGSADPFVLALNFAALSLPSLVFSAPAGVRTDQIGCERVLVQAQWALLTAAALGALAIPLLQGTAQVLLLLGLFTKGGLFLPGLWLPRSHAEAPSDVSALLSAVVVTAGVAPLLRLAAIEPALLPLVRSIGLCSAVLGVLQALSAADLKRLLAWSTVSQMGLVVLSPAAGGALALTHGLAKAPLFLTAGRIRERQLEGWGQRVLPQSVQTPLWLGSLSIAGLPGLAGFAAKKLVGSDLPPPWALSLTLIGIGSVAVYARLWSPAPAPSSAPTPGIPPGTALLLISLVGAGLILTVVSAAEANGLQANDLLTSVLQTGVVFAAGWLLHRLLGRDHNSHRRSLARRMPQLESLQDLLGAITVVGAGMLLALNLLEVPG